MRNVSLFAPQLQQAEIKKSMIHIENPRKRQALIFARLGYPVFPLHSVDSKLQCTCGDTDCARPGKHPWTPHGHLDASTDPKEIDALWRRTRSANVGVRTGNGLCVIDVDGPKGEATLASLQEEYGPLPATLTIRTGWGRHLYFTVGDLEVPCSTGKLGSGVDVRGDGGYVVGPTSRHASGKIYSPVRNGLVRAAKAPRWLIEQVTRDPIRRRNEEQADSQRRSLRPAPYGEKALKGEIANLAGAQTGTRNHTLNRAAFKLGQLASEGLLDPARITTDLTHAAREVGLRDDEIASTIHSGLQAGLLEPRVETNDDIAEQQQEPDPLTSELAQFGQTDADNARRFARRFGERLMCTPGRGFLVYDGTRWVNDRLLDHLRLAEEAARLVAGEAAYLDRDADRIARTRFAEQSCSKGAIDRMCSLVKVHLMVDDAELDVAPWFLNTLTGTINLQTGNLKPHDPGDRLTKVAPVGFDSRAECPNFMAFLRRALGDDEDLMRYVQKAVGYSVTGNTGEQVIFLAHGPTKTGKSTFLNLLRDLLGDYGLHTPSETLLAKQYDNSIPADIARLAGARMVTAIEVNWSRQIDEAKIKAMTGGDTITARHLYRDFFEFRPEFKLWFAVNDFPKVRGTDGAFWERVRVIPFKIQIPAEERDRNLQDGLMAEGAGILRWAVEGSLLWQSEGLGTCSAVEEASGHWKRAADHLQKFVNEEVVFDATSLVRSFDLYSTYRSWCDQHGETPVGDKKLKAGFEALDITSKRTRSGTVWQGIRLRMN